MQMTKTHVHQYIQLLNNRMELLDTLVDEQLEKITQLESELREAIRGLNGFEKQLMDSEAHNNKLHKEIVDLKDKEPLQRELDDIKNANQQLQGGMKELKQMNANVIAALAEVHEPIEPVQRARKILAGVM